MKKLNKNNFTYIFNKYLVIILTDKGRCTMKKDEELSVISINEVKVFIKKNSYLIYEYINIEVLKNIGLINPEYFIKIIEEMLKKEVDIKLNQNILPYFILSIIGNNGKLDYTSLRVDTINLSQINKESSSYYNYVKFSLTNDLFLIELMQNKTGGMAIKEDIVKFRKEVIIKKIGLKEFIIKHTSKEISSNNDFKRIQEAVDSI